VDDFRIIAFVGAAELHRKSCIGATLMNDLKAENIELFYSELEFFINK